MKPKIIAALAAAIVTAIGAATVAFAYDAAPEISVRDGRFEPASLTIPANKGTQLRVINDSGSAIEFESFELNRERVVAPGQSIVVNLPALSPGTYNFFDDFHRDATGAITAR